MNANELADLLETTESTNNKAATMLRQQQAEIESLRSELDRAVELYTDKAIENEELKALNKSIIDDPLQFMKIKAQKK
jgi:multidrug resistance efflux pump